MQPIWGLLCHEHGKHMDLVKKVLFTNHIAGCELMMTFHRQLKVSPQIITIVIMEYLNLILIFQL